jgi:hypothetical protein
MRKKLAVYIVLLLFPLYSVWAQNPDRTRWPAELLHPDMPVYQKGKLKGWNQWDKNKKYSIFIIIEETGQADLDAYVSRLKSAGFEEKSDLIYQKDLFEVRLQFNSSTILQISSSRINTLDWPKALLAGIPEPQGGALTQVNEPSDDMPGYVHLYYINFTAEQVDTWLQELKKAGFEIEGHSASKSKMNLGDKAYNSVNIQIEDNGTNEWMVDFNYSD